MKNKIIISGIIILFASSAFGQKVDMTRMDRDLEVAKNVLQSLMGSENRFMLWSRSIEASYLEDYGVIFTLPTEYVYSVGRNGGVVRTRTGSSDVTVGKEDLPEPVNNTEKLKEVATTFLVDYSDLIAQLSPDEKIMVRATNQSDVYISVIAGSGTTWSRDGSEDTNFSAEITKKTISDYKQGKISRDQTISLIVFTENKPEEKEQDLELFSSILGRIYSPDLSKTFFTDRGPRYERIKGFGVVFYMKTYSSYENADLYRMPVLARDDVNEEERKNTVKELYPRFKEELKNVLVEYGRTIKSLDEDEMILLKVKSTRCDDCGIPSSIELSIKKSVLSQFDQRKISLDEAIKSVKIKETSGS